MSERITKLAIAGMMVFVVAFTLYQAYVNSRGIDLNIPNAVGLASASVPDAAGVDCSVSITGSPSITAQQIDEILTKQNSPAAGTGKFMHEKGVEYGIDPVFAMAFFMKESTYGKFGVAERSHSIGNVRYTQGCDFKAESGKSGAFCGYNSWEKGIEEWFSYMQRRFVKKGITTDREIIPIYAPATENDVPKYISTIRNFVSKYKQIACTEVSEQEKKEIEVIYGNSGSLAGSYYLRPAFSVETDYDILADLRKVDNFVKEVNLLCNRYSLAEPLKCVNNYLSSHQSDIEFTAGACGDSGEKVLGQFVENYYDCAMSGDSDCMCEFSFSSAQTQAGGQYKIKICNKDGNDCDGAYIFLEEPLSGAKKFPIDKPIYLGENPSVPEEKEYIDYFVDYNDDGSFKEAKLGIKKSGFDEKWDYDIVRLYKGKDNGIIVVKDNGGKRQCASSKNIYRFCAVNRNKKATYIRNGKIVSDNLPIRFALYLADLPPPVVEGISLVPARMNDRAVIVSWKASPAEDVVSYMAYPITFDFSSWKLEGHRFVKPDGKTSFGGVELDIGNVVSYKNINTDKIPLCRFVSGICVYEYDAVDNSGAPVKISLEPGKLYFLEDKKLYLTLVDVPFTVKHYFAVTAVDKGGKEIGNSKDDEGLLAGKNYDFVIPKDELAPGLVVLENPENVVVNGKAFVRLSWDVPSDNIDGTRNTANDIENYWIFYDTDDFKSVAGMTAKQTVKTTEAFVALSDLQPNKQYYFAVVAEDKAGNLHEEHIVTKSFNT